MIKSEIVLITPAFAAELLRQNIRNRSLTSARVDRIRDAIQRGEWKLNGDAIRVSSTGVLLDGQHRLTPIMLSGLSVESFVTSGLPDEVFDTIDVNSRPRGPSDIFNLHGFKSSTSVAATALLVYQWSKSPKSLALSSSKQPTAAQLVELVRSQPEIYEHAMWGQSDRFARSYLSPSVAGFTRYVFSAHNKHAADDFFEKLATGAGLEEHSPILHLRNALLIASAKSSRDKLNRNHKIALIFKAFKQYLAGAEIKILRVRYDGDAPEKNLFELAN